MPVPMAVSASTIVTSRPADRERARRSRGRRRRRRSRRSRPARSSRRRQAQRDGREPSAERDGEPSFARVDGRAARRCPRRGSRRTACRRSSSSSGRARCTAARRSACRDGAAEPSSTISVVSWPPCRLPVDVKTQAGLPASAPENHSAPVPSMKYLSGAAMLPKRVGEPSARPAHSTRSRPLDVRRTRRRDVGLDRFADGRRPPARSAAARSRRRRRRCLRRSPRPACASRRGGCSRGRGGRASRRSGRSGEDATSPTSPDYYREPLSHQPRHRMETYASHRSCRIPPSTVAVAALGCGGRCATSCRFAATRVDEERLFQVASSLTFTTVLSLVPLATTIFGVMTALPVFNRMRDALRVVPAGAAVPRLDLDFDLQVPRPVLGERELADAGVGRWRSRSRRSRRC